MMADAETLKRTIKVCLFDQYGTVVDMQAGLREAAAPFSDGLCAVKSGANSSSDRPP